MDIVGVLSTFFTACLLLILPAASQRPIIRGFTLLLGNCAEMFLNEKPLITDVQSCGNECQRYTGCRGFSFDHNTQHCWLKWGICDRIKPARITPVVYYKNELWGFTADKGSCPGQLAAPAIFTDVVSCASQCRAMANCSGFTYDYETDVCYLKAQTCQTALSSEALAIESWVKFYRKDFWVPAALERTRKNVEHQQANSDESAADTRHPSADMMIAEDDDEVVKNPLEMVFFDNNNAAPVAQSNHLPAPSDKGDPWEAYSKPSDGSDYLAVNEDLSRVLIHRLTISNASEATCSRACSIDPLCAFFYIFRTEVPVVHHHPKSAAISGGGNNETTAPVLITKKTATSAATTGATRMTTTTTTTTTTTPSDDWPQQGRVVATMTQFQQTCVLFSKWNVTSSTSGSGSNKRRQVDDGKLFQKVAHSASSHHRSSSSSSSKDSVGAHQVTLLSLRKRKRHLEGQHEDQQLSAMASAELPFYLNTANSDIYSSKKIGFILVSITLTTALVMKTMSH